MVKNITQRSVIDKNPDMRETSKTPFSTARAGNMVEELGAFSEPFFGVFARKSAVFWCSFWGHFSRFRCEVVQLSAARSIFINNCRKYGYSDVFVFVQLYAKRQKTDLQSALETINSGACQHARSPRDRRPLLRRPPLKALESRPEPTIRKYRQYCT